MTPVSVIAIFDIGKTNKKFLLFDEAYRVVYEQSEKLEEIVDEDGDACEPLEALKSFVYRQLQMALALPQFTIVALNFSTYGASFVYVDSKQEPIAPLYNYLKQFPAALEEKFLSIYGDRENFSTQTASPWLGSLNSGLQLYRVKYQQPIIFEKMRYALHLPQYISSLITHEPVCEITSIGCHTSLWDFNSNTYHQWVFEEGLNSKFPEICSSEKTISIEYKGSKILTGIGLHDSSAALIPYLVNFEEAFVLISTGTWCISLNPFNSSPLTIKELEQDCLCYISYKGKPVKASRLFAGNDHEAGVKQLSSHFSKPPDYFKKVEYNDQWGTSLLAQDPGIFSPGNYPNYEMAYHALIWDIVYRQKISTQLVLSGTTTKRIFVDGGFSQNEVFMNMLSSVMKGIEVYAASMPQATALGAAMAIHSSWNSHALPKNLIELKFYSDR